MTEPQPRITICKWDDFQHYKDRTPPWIKLHRKLLTNREWRAIDGFSGRLLVELWLLASDKDHGPDGCVDLSTPDLAWTLRYDASEEGEIDRALQVLAEHGFVALRVNSASAAHTNARAEVEVETERDRERSRNYTPQTPHERPGCG